MEEASDLTPRSELPPAPNPQIIVIVCFGQSEVVLASAAAVVSVPAAAVVCAVSADLLPHAVNDNAIAAANIVATTDLLFIK